jgi:radical SAM superfamily enzyme YgiQ (UPF0313 family)
MLKLFGLGKKTELGDGAATGKTPKRLWLDLGDLGDLVNPAGPHEQWQDHGMGLLRTILHKNGVLTDMFSTRQCTSWDEVKKKMKGYDMLIMNVRSYTFPVAYRSAKIFKEVNPKGLVLAGGMHATVALDEMLAVPEFDKICQGPGENIIVNFVAHPEQFERVTLGIGAKSMDEWPLIDRELWPQPASHKLRKAFNWPMEPECGWGPPPVATLLTSRVCPWQCVFCNENSYIPNMGRRSVDSVIDELNFLDKQYGVGSVVIHDSMFFQNPSWLKEWLEQYPRKTKNWEYWAAARADTVRQWPDLFEAIVRETNWKQVSIGFESGSDRMLRMINKECTEEDNYFTIDLLTKIGDDMELKGQKPPVFWSNIMLGIPGETPEDAFKTMRMVKYTKRILPSISLYSPYPGSALGDQLIAEGKSKLTKENYNRFPDDEKVYGVDYQFYRELLAGKYDAEVNKGLAVVRQQRKDYSGALAKA